MLRLHGRLKLIALCGSQSLTRAIAWATHAPWLPGATLCSQAGVVLPANELQVCPCLTSKLGCYTDSHKPSSHSRSVRVALSSCSVQGSALWLLMECVSPTGLSHPAHIGQATWPWRHSQGKTFGVMRRQTLPRRHPPSRCTACSVPSQQRKASQIPQATQQHLLNAQAIWGDYSRRLAVLLLVMCW